MESKKRKRENEDDAQAVLTFHAAGGRTFDRLFKDKSLQTLKDGVRKKLRVSEQTEVRLAQLRDGRQVDLDDEDDFAALRVRSHTTSTINISVAIGNDDFASTDLSNSQQDSSLESSAPKKKKHKSRAQEDESDRRSIPIAAGPNCIATGETSSRNPKEKPAERDTAVQDKEKDKRVSRASSSSAGTQQVPVTPANKPVQIIKASGLPSPSILKPPKPAAPGDNSSTPDTGTVAQNHVDASSSNPPAVSSSKKTTSQPEASSSRLPLTSVLPDNDSSSKLKKKKRKRSPTDEDKDSMSTEQASATPVQPTKPKKSRPQEEKSEQSSSTQPQVSALILPSAEPSSKPKEKQSKSKSSEPSAPQSEPTPVSSTVSTPAKVSNKGDNGRGAKKNKMSKAERLALFKALLRKNIDKRDAKEAALRNADPKGPTMSGPLKNKVEKPTQIRPATEAKQSESSSTTQISPAPLPASDAPPKSADTERVKNAVYAVLKRNFPLSYPETPLPTSPEAQPSVSSTAPPLTQPSSSTPVLVSVPSAPRATDVFGPSATPAKEPGAVESKLSNPKRAASTSKKTKVVPCPVCDAPFHLRHLCPIVKAGPDCIEKRIRELEADGAEKELIEELKGSVAKLRAKDALATKSTEPSAVPAPVQPRSDPSRQTIVVPPRQPLPVYTYSVASQRTQPDTSPPTVVDRIVSQTSVDVPHPLPTPLSARPVIPAGSVISEVTVESHGEGSSDEDDSDDEPLSSRNFDTIKPSPSVASKGPSKVLDSTDTNDLEALLRGPPRSSSQLLAAIGSDSEDDKDDDKYLDDEDPELEEEENDRAFRRLSRRLEKEDSSDDDNEAPVVPPTVMDVDPKEPTKGQPDEPSGSRPSSASSSERAVEDTVGREESMESEVPESHPAVVRESLTSAVSRETSPEIPLDREARSSAPHRAPFKPRAGPILSSQENPDDPIESADDLLPSKKDVPLADADSDDDLIMDASARARITPPAVSPKPGTAKRMKDKRGKTPNTEPEPPSALKKVAAESTAAPAATQGARITRKRAASVSQPRPISALAKTLSQRSASQKPTSEKPSSSALMPPPPPATQPPEPTSTGTPDTSASAEPPKRRGRPRITPEEKARREAEKQALKEQKAAERAAAKAARDAEKAAAKKEKETTSRSRRTSVQKKPVLPPESEEEDVPTTAAQKPSVVEHIEKTKTTAPAPAPSGEPRLPLPPVGDSQASEISMVQWTTINRSSPETEPSLVDQLLSSSPQPNPIPDSPDVIPFDTPAASQQQGRSSSTSANSHLPQSTPNASQTPAGKGNKMSVSSLLTSSPPTIRRRPDQTPLFLPGDSSQIDGLSMDFPSQGDNSLLDEEEDEEDDEEEVAPTPSQQSQLSRKPPSRPSLIKPTPLKPIIPKWRRLSDLSSQQLFSSPSTPILTPIIRGDPNVLKAKRGLLNGNGNGGKPADSSDDDDDDEESSSSSSSEDEDADRSHIPKNRRAGSGAKKPKKGLLDYA